MRSNPKKFAMDNNPAPVPAMFVATYILKQRYDRQRQTTTLDLIKLVYLSHGWFLGIYGIPLIREAVEAWPYGPVIPIVYERFKSYRGNPIDLVPIDNSSQLDLRQRAVIDETLRAYDDFDSWGLSAITHKPGTPWDQISDLGLWQIIPNSLIRQHYAGLYEREHAS